MIFWFVATIALLIWNAIYCSMKIIGDLRGPKPANGVWGLLALAGVLSVIAIALVSLGVAASGI